MNKWKIKKKAEESNVLDSGEFIDGSGTWKKVLNGTKDITILGVPVKVNIWHYEVNSNNEDTLKWYDSNELHYIIVNREEAINKLNNLIKNQLREQLSQFGSRIQSSVSYHIDFPTEGDFRK